MKHPLLATLVTLGLASVLSAAVQAIEPTLDIIFANQGQVNRVCFGDGVGNFTCSDVSANTDSSQAVALGFVDGDTTLDAVFANLLEPNSVCLGDGLGGFSCGDMTIETTDSRSVALGYFNSDQHLDAVFANNDFGYEGRPNHICLGDGTGAFACTDVSPDTNNSYGVALGYIDDNPMVFIDSFESGDILSWSAWLPRCFGDSDCDEDEFCKKNGCGASSGFCKTRPWGCIDVWDPVCGCDDATYSNACYAERAGVNIASSGECPP